MSDPSGFGFAEIAHLVTGNLPDFYIGDTVRIHPSVVERGVDQLQGTVLRIGESVDWLGLERGVDDLSRRVVLRSSYGRKELPSGVLQLVECGPNAEFVGTRYGRAGEVIRVSDATHKRHGTEGYILGIGTRKGEIWYVVSDVEICDQLAGLDNELMGRAEHSERKVTDLLGKLRHFIPHIQIGSNDKSYFDWRKSYYERRRDVAIIVEMAAMNYMNRWKELRSKERFMVAAESTELMQHEKQLHG